MKYAFIVALSLTLAEAQVPVGSGTHWSHNEPTKDSRIIRIRGARWGVIGEGYVESDIVPTGQIWLIQTCGISTRDGRYLEWMMQITWRNPNDSKDYRLFAVTRNVGLTAGAPTLALNRPVILQANECLSARVNGSGVEMGLNWIGWSLPEDYLPALLGITGSNSQLDSANREILSLEEKLKALK